jgi:hypothetical protein
MTRPGVNVTTDRDVATSVRPIEGSERRPPRRDLPAPMLRPAPTSAGPQHSTCSLCGDPIQLAADRWQYHDGRPEHSACHDVDCRDTAAQGWGMTPYVRFSEETAGGELPHPRNRWFVSGPQETALLRRYEFPAV